MTVVLYRAKTEKQFHSFHALSVGNHHPDDAALAHFHVLDWLLYFTIVTIPHATLKPSLVVVWTITFAPQMSYDRNYSDADTHRTAVRTS